MSAKRRHAVYVNRSLQQSKKMKLLHILIVLIIPFAGISQEAIEWQEELDLEQVEPNTKQRIWLRMIDKEIDHPDEPVMCKKSYWIYVEEGGYLEVMVDLKQKLKKGELIAVMRNPFGDILNKYHCPEDGIVIGKSSNPINMNGGRIIHLGIYMN